MTPMRFSRVSIIKNNQVIDRGYLNKMMPQSDDSYLYEIYGDSGQFYVLTEDQFFYNDDEENNEPKWER